MGETVNIKQIADILSKEIFSIFHWDQCLATDHQWNCVEPHAHKKPTNGASLTKKGKEKKMRIKLHPSDAVFTYSDPYRGNTTYINADLKSYSKDSIETFNLESTIRNLANAVECAHKSETFSEAFAQNEIVEAVDGLLFIYNHDSEYDKDFDSRIQKLSSKNLGIKENQRIFIIGPSRVIYIHSIARDIQVRQSKLFSEGGYKCYKFYSPEFRKTKIRGEKWGVAPIESLIGPWLFVVFFGDDDRKIVTVVYYDGEGDSQDEFEYLIDALLSYNILEDNTPIQIALQTNNNKSAIHFAKALKNYATANHGRTDDSLEAFKRRLNRISYSSVPTVRPSFMESEIAIKNG